MPLLSLIFALQFAGAVHALRRGASVGLAMAIAFLPLVGGFIYLFSRASSGPREARTTDGEAAPARLRAADLLLTSGEAHRAAALCREGLDARGRGDPRVMRKLAEAYLAGDHPAAARETLDALAGAHPESGSPAVRLLYARALEGEGRLADARRAYEALAAASPCAETRFRYASLLRRSGEPERAQAILDALLRAHRDASSRTRRRDRAWIRQAERALRAARPALPSPPEAHHHGPPR